MRKISTMFERDWDGDRSRVLPVIHPGCEWVQSGEGVATQKIDGTCCLIRDGKLFKRQEYKAGAVVPPDFEEVDQDEETGKRVGWRPVGDGPEDKWHREGFENSGEIPDGTYELIGPKVQGNPEKRTIHLLIVHGAYVLASVPRSFDELKSYLSNSDMEGIVFHHPDGRMAKIKRRDFGLPWPIKP